MIPFNTDESDEEDFETEDIDEKKAAVTQNIYEDSNLKLNLIIAKI